jgi:hypothetical protein
MPLHERHVPEYESVPIVDRKALSDPSPRSVLGYTVFDRTILKRLRTNTVSRRSAWVRFLAFSASSDDIAAMPQSVFRNATLLLDRHYNSLWPYSVRHSNIYVVSKGESVFVRQLQLNRDHLILRPETDQYPLDFIRIEKRHGYGEHILGRVCQVWGQI